MEHIGSLILMIMSEILLLGIAIFLKKEKKSQLKTAFYFVILCLSSWTFCSILQVLFQNTDIDPFFWEKLAGFGVCFSPVAFLTLSQVFAKTKIEFKWYHLLILVIPITTVILTFTNEYHHLVFVNYSINMNETIYGKYFNNVYSIFNGVLYATALFYFLRYSIKNSGFFSRQSLLIIIGTCIPLFFNGLGTLRVIPVTMYMTPISFSFLAFCFAIAIFKFKFLKLAPIALQRIVDRMSDSYIVINEENTITDFNKTLLDTLKIKDENVRNKNIFDFINKHGINEEKMQQALIKVKSSPVTETFEIKIEKVQKYFTVEINAIRQRDQFLGTLILFKDITQHKQDMETIHRNQDILVERERLASLGQMIGGIAHNLKTPIMSISGATEGLNDLIKEYDASIDNPQVNSEDHHAIAKDMSGWIEKIRGYLEYMSDVITAVKGQAVNFSEEQNFTFTIADLIKHVNILMKHELKNAIVYLNTDIRCDENTKMTGNMNSLVQVINNMISNAIQAYAGVPDKNIDLTISEDNDNIIISVKDYGPGLPEKVQEKLFKEMITTKGKNGTGLGLYMSYSNKKAHFNGDITVYTKQGEGTTFNIILPIMYKL